MRRFNILLWIAIGCMAILISGCKNKDAMTNQTEEESQDAFFSSVIDKIISETEEEKETETEIQEEAEEIQIPEASYQVKTQTTYEVLEWDPDLQMNLVTAYYDKIILSEDAPTALKSAIDKLNEENCQKVVNDAQGLNESAKEFAELSDYFSTWEQANTVYVKRADDKIFSVKIDEYRYFGGAHPTYITTTYTYDVNTGKVLSINEVIVAYDKLYELVLGKLKEINESEEFLSGYYDNYEEIVHDYFYGEYKNFLSWTIDNSGLSIYFDSYVIGPYVRGNTVLDFSYEEYKDIFYPKFVKEADSYVWEMEMFQPAYVDVNHDGEKDEINVMYAEYEEDYYTDYTIYFNDETLDVTMFGEHTGAYLMEGTDGEYYLYLENVEMNDYQYISIFQFKNGVPECVGEPEEAFYGWHVLSPEMFLMSRKIDLLGSYRGSRYCYVGEGGMPVPYDKEYTLDQTWVEGIVSIKELPVKMLNKDGNYEESTLPAGTKYIPYATDGSSYMKFTLTSGAKGMLEITQEDYVKYIGGVSEYECFEMLPYAG